MSASREKKGRLGDTQALTQKQLQEAKEAAQAKRRSKLYWCFGIVVAILVAALLLWDSGIFMSRKTVATVGEENLTVAEMQYYYGLVRSSELNQQQTFSQWGISIMTAPYANYDFSSAEGDEQIYNSETSQTYREHFRESALDTARDVVALTSAAAADGFSLSSEGKKSVEDGMRSIKEQVKAGGWSSFSTYLRSNFGKYVTEGVYSDIQAQSALASEFQAQKSDSLTYTTEQLDQYATENPAQLLSYDYRFAQVSGAPETKKDADGKDITPTDEETTAASQAAKAKADAIAEAVEDATAVKKSDAFGQETTAQLGADSTWSKEENNLRSKVLGSQVSQEGSTYFSWLSDPARKAGDVTVIPSGSDYYVVLFLGAALDSTPTVDLRQILIKAETPVDDPATTDVDESTQAPTQEALDAAKGKAQGLLDEFSRLSDDTRTAETFGRMAEENSEDSSSSSNGGLYSYVTEGSLAAQFGQEMDAWAFESTRKSGDVALVSNVGEGSDYSYQAVYFAGQNGPKWHELAQNALRSDDLSKWLESVKEPYAANWTDDGNIIGK